MCSCTRWADWVGEWRSYSIYRQLCIMYYVHWSPLSSHYELFKWSDWIQELETGELPPDPDTAPPPTAPLLNGWSCRRVPAQRWCICSVAALKIAPIQSGHAVCFPFLHPCPIPPSPVPSSLCCWDFYVSRSSLLPVYLSDHISRN